MEDELSENRIQNLNKMEKTRRKFIKSALMGSAGIGLAPAALSAKNYRQVVGANDRVNFAVVGLYGRGKALLDAAAKAENTAITWLVDVDSRVFDSSIKTAKDITGNTPKTNVDIREVLEKQDVDAVAIAAPDHWHAPMAIMAAQAGKNVYLEKPASHNPQEGEWLTAVKEKTGKVMQLGTQQRSAPTSIEVVEEIRNGIIGKPYYGKAWYSNARGPIGMGQQVPVPEWLNWELWQGPAPRREYQDIWVHYNWHWFWEYGTGEVNNNGLHELDICRWALGVDYPVKVTSSGGRFHYDDDWEFYDTQIVNYEFQGDKMMSWEGKSCNPFQFYDRGRGSTIHGTKGTALIDRNGYIVYDLDGKLIKSREESEVSATLNTIGAGGLDDFHMENFLNAIRKGEKLNAPVAQGVISTTICHLGNIAQVTGRTLHVDPEKGRILGDGEAMSLWGREYEPGWRPLV
jgi:predicted dehydrogenase